MKFFFGIEKILRFAIEIVWGLLIWGLLAFAAFDLRNEKRLYVKIIKVDLVWLL